MPLIWERGPKIIPDRRERNTQKYSKLGVDYAYLVWGLGNLLLDHRTLYGLTIMNCKPAILKKNIYMKFREKDIKLTVLFEGNVYELDNLYWRIS